MRLESHGIQPPHHIYPPYMITVLLTCPQSTFLCACMLATYTNTHIFPHGTAYQLCNSTIYTPTSHIFCPPSRPMHHYPCSYNYNHYDSYLFIFNCVSPTFHCLSQSTTLLHLRLMLL